MLIMNLLVRMNSMSSKEAATVVDDKTNFKDLARLELDLKADSSNKTFLDFRGEVEGDSRDRLDLGIDGPPMAPTTSRRRQAAGFKTRVKRIGCLCATERVSRRTGGSSVSALTIEKYLLNNHWYETNIKCNAIYVKYRDHFK